MFSQGAEFEILLEAHDHKGNVVGEARKGDPVDPATGTLMLKPGEQKQVTIRMDLEFEGKFTLKAFNPITMTAYLTNRFGLITDYLAEAFHYQLKHNNRYEEVSSRLKLGRAVEGRDEKGIKKTLCAFLKILHPDGPPSDEEFFEYVDYAVECRRRIKEQMNKRKPDDEFALIDLSYFDAAGREVVVHCPETKGITATLEPNRRKLSEDFDDGDLEIVTQSDDHVPAQEEATISVAPKEPTADLKEVHYSINYGDTGHTYDSIVGPYLQNAKEVVVEDPYIRAQHQIVNFVRFCETVVKTPSVQKIHLITSYDDKTDMALLNEKMDG